MHLIYANIREEVGTESWYQMTGSGSNSISFHE